MKYTEVIFDVVFSKHSTHYGTPYVFLLYDGTPNLSLREVLEFLSLGSAQGTITST